MERKRIEKLVAILLIGILLPISLFPFRIYASVQSQIVPTFSSTSSQWSTHLSVTNFSDGTNSQASSTLSFTFDDDYYGMVYFDGYGPSNQHIANYAVCFIAGGYGEYRYSYYQNGVINITSVTIQVVNVVKPDTSVDLTQIIALLTAIESDTSSIDLLVDQTKSQIINVLNQLVISNGYLETLTKVRDFDVYIESYPFIIDVFRNNNFTYVDLANFYHLNYPIFSCLANTYISQYRVYRANNAYVRIIFGSSLIFTKNTFSTYFSSNFDLIELIELNNYANFRIFSLKFQNKTGSAVDFKLQTLSAINSFIPIYLNPEEYTNISTDFALLFGLSNQLLDDIHLIAQGTSQSSSASGSLDQTTSQFSSDANNLVTIEETFNNSMNQSLQSVNPTFNMGSSFLASANWVSQQFNRIVNNTPFASLITFGLTLGLGLLIIGKVRK